MKLHVLFYTLAPRKRIFSITITRLIRFQRKNRASAFRKEKKRTFVTKSVHDPRKEYNILSVKLVRFPRYRAGSGFLQPRKTRSARNRAPLTIHCHFLISNIWNFSAWHACVEEFDRSLGFSSHGKWHDMIITIAIMHLGSSSRPKGSINSVFRPIVKMPDTSTPEESGMELWGGHRFRILAPGWRNLSIDRTAFHLSRLLWIGEVRKMDREFLLLRRLFVDALWIFLNLASIYRYFLLALKAVIKGTNLKFL